MSLLKKSKLEFDEKGNLVKMIVGTCDKCGKKINNVKEGYIIEKDGKVYHAGE